MKNVFKLFALIFVLTLSNSSLSADIGPCSDADCVSYFKAYKRLARVGHSAAMTTLGELYYHGYGVEKNIKLALKQFRRAAKYNSISGQNKAGLLYFTEPEVLDKEEGLKYLKEAARNKHGDSAALLGVIYFSADYGFYDLAQSDKWFSKAIKLGHKQVRDMIEVVSQSKEFTPKNFPELSEVITQLLVVNKPLLPASSISHVQLDDNSNKSQSIVWPDDEMEVISVSAPSLQDIFDKELEDLKGKYPDKYATATGTNIIGRSCEQMVSCNETNKEEFKLMLSQMKGF